MKYYDLLTQIENKVQNSYNGYLDTEKEKADLYVYIDGIEQRIKGISTDTIYFENKEYTKKLIDSDIHHLAYLNKAI